MERLFTTLLWLCSECGGPQHHLQLQFISCTIRRDGGGKEVLPAVNDKKLNSWHLPNFIQVWMQASPCRGTQPGIERHTEDRQSRKVPGVSRIRSKVSHPHGVLAGGQLCRMHGAGVHFPRAQGDGHSSPGRVALWPVPANPVPGRLCWGLAKMTFLLGLFCWGGMECVWSSGLWNAQNFIAP